MRAKICTKCGQIKPESDFGWERPGHRNAACKECRAKYQAEYYLHNKEKELAYKAKRQIDRREEARVYVHNYKSTHPCVDCGNSNPLVLAFDHVRGKKKMAISQMVNQGYAIEVIQAEIDKCELVCHNCHILREIRRRGTVYY